MPEVIKGGCRAWVKRVSAWPRPLLSVSWQSEVLTVWRRLHLEVDSMANAGNVNTVSGTIKAVENNQPQAGQSWVFIDQPLGGQSRNQKDFDPNQQLGLFGWCVLSGSPCGDLSILYVEQYRDPGGCGGLDPQAGVRSGLQATVAHEIGHSFGGLHDDGGIMASGVEACLKKNPQFTDITLNRIRSTKRPGGGTL